MHIQDCSDCCTLLELTNFGDDAVDWQTKKPISDCGKDLQQFVKNLEKRIRDFDNNHYNAWENEDVNKQMMFSSRAILIATTIDSQKIPAEYLKQLGFKATLKNVKKYKHSENKLTLWCIRISTLLKNIKKLKGTF